jgi:hypothetical protein
MINGKASVFVTDETHDDENHEDDVSPYGGHGVYDSEGMGKAARMWNNLCLMAHNGRLVRVLSLNDGAAHAKIAR